MPARKIPKNYRSSTGIFQSYKNQSPIAYESLLERNFYLLLEFDNTVKAYEEQPFTIKYTRNGATYRYTPDCLVFYKENTDQLPCVFEVKESSEIKEKKVFFEEKFKQIEEYLAQNDMDFKLFTELDIDNIFLENAKFLYSYANLHNSSIIEQTKQLCKQYNNISFSDLLQQFSKNKFEQAEYIPYIWHLVFIGYLNVDMKQLLNNNTIIGYSNE